MLPIKKRLFWKIILVASLLSPFAFFSSNLTPWSPTHFIGRVAQEIIYPFEYAWHTTTGFVGSTWNNYFALSDAARKNESLQSEVSQLKAKLLDYDEQLNEVSRLRKLLGFTQRYQKKHLVAEVISTPREDPFYTMRIGKGELDEVQIGMPIVTANGVIGRVIRTGLKYSDVQLLTDSNFHLDVLLQRTRVRGVLRGERGAYCTLKLNRRAEIRIGDTVITSGIVGGFPKGLPVGQVVRISYETDHISQVITVEPWVDHHRIEEVIVLQNPDKEMQKIVETVGKNWLTKSLDSGTGGG